MTSQAQTRDPDAAAQTSGSAAAEAFRCEVCGREFKIKLALFNHLKSHDLKPGQQPGVEPEIKVRKTARLSQKELGELQVELADNIRAVGGLLHAGLTTLKVWRLQNPETRIRVPGTRAELELPAFETHLPYTLISRSEMTAKVLVDHAAESEALLRWLVRFNGWFKGGEVGQLVGAHVVAGVMTLGAGGPILGSVAGILIQDVVAQVEAENAELRHQVQQLQAQRAQEAGGWRPPADERGAGG